MFLTNNIDTWIIYEEMLLRVLTQAELKSFNSVKHKLK